jgi:hypothetical protein
LQNLEVASETSTSEPEQTQNLTNSTWALVVAGLNAAWGRASAATLGLSFNFVTATQLLGVSIVFTVLLITGLFTFLLSGALNRPSFAGRQALTSQWLSRLGAALLFTGLLANEIFVARYLSRDGILEAATIYAIRTMDAIFVVLGTALWGGKRTIAAKFHDLAQAIGSSKQQNVLAFSLIIPWITLLVITETNRLDRIWWVWPLQLVFLAALTMYIPSKLKMARIWPQLGAIVLVVMLAANPFLISRVTAWARDGWSGPDAPEVELTDSIASQLHSKNQNRAAIGYQTFIWNYMAAFNVMDRRYKVGADFDLLLRSRHAISNMNQCAEGVSPNDNFRVVQPKPPWTDFRGKGKVDVSLGSELYLLREFGSYRLFQRDN